MSGFDALQYRLVVSELEDVFQGDIRHAKSVALARMEELATQSRFEEAVVWRERLSSLARASARTMILQTLAGIPELVVARPTSDGGWDAHCIRFGMLAGATRIPAGVDPKLSVEALRSAASVITANSRGMVAGLAEEAREIWTWSVAPDARIVHLDGEFALPLHCGGDFVDQLDHVTRQQQLLKAVTDPVTRPQGPAPGRAVTRIAANPPLAL
jgi:DNA polymerase-3 subunit epsilon